MIEELFGAIFSSIDTKGNVLLKIIVIILYLSVLAGLIYLSIKFGIH